MGEGGIVIEEEKQDVNMFNYGFGMNYENVLDNLQEENAEIFQFDPKKTALPLRHQLGNEIVIKKFDYDSYLFDKYDNEDEIGELLYDKTVIQHLQEKMKQKQEGPQINQT